MRRLGRVRHRGGCTNVAWSLVTRGGSTPRRADRRTDRSPTLLIRTPTTSTFVADRARTTIPPKNSNGATQWKSTGSIRAAGALFVLRAAASVGSPRDLLRPTKDHLAVVTGERVVSRVGSGMSDVRDVIQVRLDRGEQVEILETRSPTTAGHAEAWCKITPPSGEFRWVFGKFVDANSSGPQTDTDHEAAISHRADSTKHRYYMADLDAKGDPDAPPADDHRTVHRTSGESPAAASPGSPSATGALGAGNAAAPANLASPDGFQAELNAIDVAVSAMVVEDSSTWKFDDLKRRSQTALEHAQTAVERGKARLLLDRIARFEDIKRRRDDVAGIQTTTDRKNLQMAGVSDVRAPVGLAQVENAAKWDATGKLTNVVSPRPNAPTYALLNSDREVVAFITPAPGVNLKAMVGRQIGISGQRGYMPELRKPHITALASNAARHSSHRRRQRRRRRPPLRIAGCH